MRALSRLIAVLALSAGLPALAAALPDCRTVAAGFGRDIDAAELAEALSALNRDGRLPPRYLTKREAREAGWQPGRPLWQVPGLHGRSIGGDRFGNREGRLPRGDWREADLDYRGGRRGADRLVFEPRRDGRRFVTVDHYESFKEAPACR
ncbi:ribonuclease domain-containing protein [Chitinimonas koreensis]|uniref:ribonuclease domain-containing protein n=1 Tax=Chitinimonas koreensis TaxID=356302 RepID=UPI0003FE8384|nr:ribonuclease domain-containing protein [Chitinimonas koreensis]QNM97495.1 ribonuclease [Chitinimonas koreensis]